ncbi:hypothetical protein [Pseudomonas coleopterorum]|uniref:hypothetical protein n=1 Tax=Pseudomonas coleopterorum TaxID=1605838 RepID=UPI00089B7452|nr:hypothetical protein [Pseudomonas coleopterorum]SEE25054.1 hypothetical protein SAMN05216510_1950 [Pseudomonas coleopterorum]
MPWVIGPGNRNANGRIMNHEGLAARAAALSDLALDLSVFWISFDHLAGAVLGACLVVSQQSARNGKRRLCNLLLAIGVGLLFAPMAENHIPQLTCGIAAFGCALLVIPLSLKVRNWIRQLDIEQILRRFRGP